MVQSLSAPMNDGGSKILQIDSQTPSGVGRGGNFFALDRDLWTRLWEVETME